MVVKINKLICPILLTYKLENYPGKRTCEIVEIMLFIVNIVLKLVFFLVNWIIARNFAFLKKSTEQFQLFIDYNRLRIKYVSLLRLKRRNSSLENLNQIFFRKPSVLFIHPENYSYKQLLVPTTFYYMPPPLSHQIYENYDFKTLFCLVKVWFVWQKLFSNSWNKIFNVCFTNMFKRPHLKL